MLIYAAMFACAALLVVLVRRYHLYGREPWYMVVLALVLGAAMMWAVGVAEDYALGHLRLSGGRPLDESRLAAKAALVAGMEETAKLAVVLLIALLFPRRFRDPLDGLIYGTLAGLGTAVEESLMYLGFAPETLGTLGAEVVRLVGHSLMGGVIGFAVGLALAGGGTPRRRRSDFGPRRRAALTAACVAVSVLVHFAWDYIAYRQHPGAGLRGFLMLLMLALMLLWGAMVAFAANHTRRDGSRRPAAAPAGAVPGALGG